MMKRVESAAGWLAYLIWLVGSWALTVGCAIAAVNGQWLGMFIWIALPCALYMTINRRDFMDEPQEG